MSQAIAPDDLTQPAGRVRPPLGQPPSLDQLSNALQGFEAPNLGQPDLGAGGDAGGQPPVPQQPTPAPSTPDAPAPPPTWPAQPQINKHEPQYVWDDQPDDSVYQGQVPQQLVPQQDPNGLPAGAVPPGYTPDPTQQQQPSIDPALAAAQQQLDLNTLTERMFGQPLTQEQAIAMLDMTAKAAALAQDPTKAAALDHFLATGEFPQAPTQQPSPQPSPYQQPIQPPPPQPSPYQQPVPPQPSPYQQPYQPTPQADPYAQFFTDPGLPPTSPYQPQPPAQPYPGAAPSVVDPATQARLAQLEQQLAEQRQLQAQQQVAQQNAQYQQAVIQGRERFNQTPIAQTFSPEDRALLELQAQRSGLLAYHLQQSADPAAAYQATLETIAYSDPMFRNQAAAATAAAAQQAQREDMERKRRASAVSGGGIVGDAIQQAPVNLHDPHQSRQAMAEFIANAQAQPTPGGVLG